MMKLVKPSVIPLVAMAFISMFMAFPIFPAAATPGVPLPTLEAIPNVITIPEAGTTVSIEIWAKNVAAEIEITGFQFNVPFNTQWLAPAFPVKGDFMEAFVNGGELDTDPNPYYTVVSDIPYETDWNLTKAMVMIMPDPDGVYWDPFPSGEGRLITLRYTGTGEGAGESMPIDMTDILILDKDMEEVPYGPGDLNGELYGWKFKVNGKAGVGLGHKSTVLQVNTFEVQVVNTGNIDVNVRATFDIVSAMAVDTVTSATVLLPAGQSTVLSATWTAFVPGHYEITGNLHLGPLDYFTRTQTLRIDVKPS